MSSNTNCACPCLNVHIRIQHPPSTQSSPLQVSDPNYRSVFVGEEGISIVHPQLTLRSRTHSKPEPKSNTLLRRHTSLTCLICRIPVYRVLQLIPPDLATGEGPILPTEEWVEQEILRSRSGWIELTKQSLENESITQLQSSEAYSPVFRVVLPTRLVPFPPPPLSASRPPSPVPRQSDTPHKVLPPLSPLFPPPPFVPSHPAFDHLSAIALQRSDQLRKSAEEHVSQIVDARILEIEKEEAELQRQVQLLWAAFREAESVLTQEKKLQPPSKQPTPRDQIVAPPLSHTGQGSSRVSPVAINDFVPVSNIRPSSPIHGMPSSALSVSLASSSFHHPIPSREGRRSTSPIGTILSRPLPTGTTLVEGINYRDPVRRDMNERKDIATSFKYVVDMEAEKSARARQYQSLSNIKSPRVNAKLTGHVNPIVSDVAAEHSDPIPGPSTSKNQVSSEELLSPSGSKGKRKVTFDIKPVVEKDLDRVEEPGEASIFELDDGDFDVSQKDPSYSLTLPLREPVDSPARPPRQSRLSSGSALPHFLQTLRPASLPATVALRASASPRPESFPQKNATPPSATEKVEANVDEALSSRVMDLARLVNVITPSHRNAWKKDSQSWKLFSSRSAGDASPESLDNETDTIPVPHGAENNVLLNSGVSASLPISIAVVPQIRAPKDGPLNESDAKPKPALTSASYRRASYAARDRSRSLDPGALDFETGALDFEIDGDDESMDGDDGDVSSLSRGRRRALRILQARSELPAEGMWRSLAT
ncbi:hypothetical protein B0F90DRAFT_1813941 [Multifurca ochricompacta]|uniref:Uncharacterized protein n=1 Tax=Multifurca ochricompacta TaxID=376703 RepID=A0AAD4QSV6_9AGAM|nr:hypothetical protein B0F90DRAFT_1813941 [Multifurca ochricompacta]